jgi:starch phosphorylase
MRQEIVLGIGGLRALKELGIEPTVYHMNEGHSAFLALERIRVLMKELYSTRLRFALRSEDVHRAVRVETGGGLVRL